MTGAESTDGREPGQQAKGKKAYKKIATMGKGMPSTGTLQLTCGAPCMFFFGARWGPCRKTSNHNWGDASGPDPSVAARGACCNPLVVL